MVKHNETILPAVADELFECAWPFCGVIYLFYLFSLYLKLTFPSLQLKPINVN